MALLIASGLGAGGHAAPLPPFLLLPRARDCALYAGGRALEAVRDGGVHVFEKCACDSCAVRPAPITSVALADASECVRLHRR